ncbi:3-methyladenine DNA glycosylase AlkD [Evansella vedderi]|uniref:3-methyladenine DNA glycosylase AlkD n=1 Tax=Evansella vedderi TaxID=38282 RepID=A0ABU0A1Q5_9BACI|nr:DNA alkylation repair protein [Evansella vedderi]MDQ0257419.1 3-methyladenine DNA glycosylase AlkD [Evansella vedderi]
MYLEVLKELFEANKNEENATPMTAYMKNHFSFLGIKTPERRRLLEQFYCNTDILNLEELPLTFLQGAWNLPEREYQYAVLSMMVRRPRWILPEHVPWIEELITTKSWWDTVDTIATNIVGELFARESHLLDLYIPVWRNHENLWLRRTALLFQLKYKGETNADLLYGLIRDNKDHKDFFIRKAIGWALREYSKTDPESVEAFIRSEDLSPLSVREGMKHIIRERA